MDVAGLTDAAHTLEVRATDKVGNVGESASRTFVLDVVPDPAPTPLLRARPSDSRSTASGWVRLRR